MTMNKFVIQHGRVATRASISFDALDEGLLSTARGALAHLREGKPTVSISWPDGTNGIVGFGLPSLELPVEHLSDALRETWETGREARERKQKSTNFYVTTASETEVYCLAREAAVFEDATPWNLASALKVDIERTNLAGLYGAVVGTFGQVEKAQTAKSVSGGRHPSGFNNSGTLPLKSWRRRRRSFAMAG
jgi:hypothetical protein